MTTGRIEVEKTKPPPPAQLPKLELFLYFSIWISHCLYAFYFVFDASSTLESHLSSNALQPGWTILNKRPRDLGFHFWHFWFQFLPSELVLLLLHFISMRILEKLIEDKKKLENAMLLTWTVLLWSAVGWFGVVAKFASCALILIVARKTKRKSVLIIFGCCLLWTAAIVLLSGLIPLHKDKSQTYRLIIRLAYNLPRCISFCIYYLDAKNEKAKTAGNLDEEKAFVEKSDFASAYYAVLLYALYPPYTVIIMVTYRNFLQQWRNRGSVKPKYASLLFMAVRVGFWAIFYDFILHFIYVYACLSDADLLREVTLPSLLAIVYTASQCFSMCYTAIFGVDSIFALLDGMTPPEWPPCCVSRISLPSEIWRNFNRGVHGFLQEHVFVPIASPSFSFPRRLLAALACFSCSLAWHGPTPRHALWSFMNFAEITLENTVKMIFRSPSVENIRSRFSPLNIRRCRALAQALCPLFSMLSFVTLTSKPAMDAMFSRVVFSCALLPWVYLIGLGYCIAQCSMEFETGGCRVRKA